MFEPSEV